MQALYIPGTAYRTSGRCRERQPAGAEVLCARLEWLAQRARPYSVDHDTRLPGADEVVQPSRLGKHQFQKGRLEAPGSSTGWKTTSTRIPIVPSPANRVPSISYCGRPMRNGGASRSCFSELRP